MSVGVSYSHRSEDLEDPRKESGFHFKCEDSPGGFSAGELHVGLLFGKHPWRLPERTRLAGGEGDLKQGSP